MKAVFLAGATGRLGNEILSLLSQHPFLHLSKALVSKQSSKLSEESGFFTYRQPLLFQAFDPSFSPPDILIDVSIQDSSELLQWSVEKNIPYLTGSTGLSEDFLALLQKSSQHIPVMQASNFSVGIALLKSFFRHYAAALNEHYKLDLFETHHKEKKDQPSGTALDLAQCFTSPPDIESQREGEERGFHQLTAKSPYETLSFSHQVHHRKAFALGAIKAAEFLLKQPPGFYSFEKVYAWK